ncbi:hypothetical protein KAI54_03630, partial [Candidatus Gracilibacteria bacterium]|nr:hypothetical protein [Candidatus Gracilibacteria bacterium]
FIFIFEKLFRANSRFLDFGREEKSSFQKLTNLFSAATISSSFKIWMNFRHPLLERKSDFFLRKLPLECEAAFGERMLSLRMMKQLGQFQFKKASGFKMKAVISLEHAAFFYVENSS